MILQKIKMKKTTLILISVMFLFSNEFLGQNTNKDNNYTLDNNGNILDTKKINISKEHNDS